MNTKNSCAILIIILSLLFFCVHSWDFAAAQRNLLAAAEPVQQEADLESGEIGPLEEGENDKDTPDIEAGNDSAVLSDDQQADSYPAAIAGKYAWQSQENDTLASFGNVIWISGFEFVPDSDAAVSELCGYFDDSSRKVSLYDAAFKLLAEVTVASDNGWNCVSTGLVNIDKGQVYYAVSRSENEQVYYNYQCCDQQLLPVKAAGITINAGVRQEGGGDFGPGLKRYRNIFFGLVDVKISTRNAKVPAWNTNNPAPSGTRPVITDPQPSGTISNSKPLLSVHTNRNTTCRYDKTKKNYADLRYSFTTTGGTTSTRRIGPLTDGTYTRWVRCKDANGYISYATEIKFTVSNASDSNIYKPVITDMKPFGTITDNTPTISVKTDENATCKYCTKNVSYNDSTYCTAFSTTGGKSHSATLSALNDGDYTYYVRCRDEAGNTNTSSKKIIFTITSGGSDTTPPAISNVSASPASGAVGASFAIKATISDSSGIKSAKAKIQIPDQTTVASLTLYDDGAHNDGSANDGVYGRTWLSTGRTAGKYYIDIEAVDNYDNSQTLNNGATITLDGGGDDDDDVDTSCVPLLKNGAPGDKIDIVFLPSNYRTDMTTFESDAKKHMNAVFAATPLGDYKQYFNVWIIKKNNLTSNSDLCAALDDVTEFKTLSAKCGADETAILSKTTGGSFGGCADPDNTVAFMLSNYTTAMPHELGHAIFKLWDEYVYSEAYVNGEFDDSYWCGTNPGISFDGAPNCDKNSSCSKWSQVAGANCVKGCTCSNAYRPISNCMMREYGSFCPVCSAQIKKIINNYK